MTRKWRPLEPCFEAVFDVILFSFHKETGVQISMKLVLHTWEDYRIHETGIWDFKWQWRPHRSWLSVDFDVILFSFHKETGDQIDRWDYSPWFYKCERRFCTAWNRHVYAWKKMAAAHKPALATVLDTILFSFHKKTGALMVLGLPWGLWWGGGVRTRLRRERGCSLVVWWGYPGKYDLFIHKLCASH